MSISWSFASSAFSLRLFNMPVGWVAQCNVWQGGNERRNVVAQPESNSCSGLTWVQPDLCVDWLDAQGHPQQCHTGRCQQCLGVWFERPRQDPGRKQKVVVHWFSFSGGNHDVKIKTKQGVTRDGCEGVGDHFGFPPWNTVCLPKRGRFQRGSGSRQFQYLATCSTPLSLWVVRSFKLVLGTHYITTESLPSQPTHILPIVQLGGMCRV